jgi:hypothetical protein
MSSFIVGRTFSLKTQKEGSPIALKERSIYSTPVGRLPNNLLLMLNPVRTFS